MANLFQELREHLLRSGVAPRHVRRYMGELADHLADLQAEEERAGRSRLDAAAAALVRLGAIEELSKAMIEQPRFQAWSGRAPWAIFGLGPLVVLAGAYFVACFILWSGWTIFLQGADTPFGGHGVHGFANLYFQAGKALYFGAPLLVGWGVELIAARQRLNVIWPLAGLLMTALVGATVRIQAGRKAVPGGIGHIRMDLSVAPSAHAVFSALLSALVILTLTALPYLVWRIQRVTRIPLDRDPGMPPF